MHRNCLQLRHFYLVLTHSESGAELTDPDLCTIVSMACLLPAVRVIYLVNATYLQFLEAQSELETFRSADRRPIMVERVTDGSWCNLFHLPV